MSDPRWVSEKSRVTWENMTRKEHAAIIRAVRKGEPTQDPATALLALHWAWAVIGPPGARKRYPWLSAIFDARGQSFLTDIYNGTWPNDVRTLVRRNARRVEAAYLPFLESLGVDTDQS
ncbi:hypothetical protein [Streptomyces graminilatus]|uniref:hypothetical protein n=1 Tax=Streptomyces graminilatus TaxID=1464070 RepID=UPI0006E29ABE|nr:hypothetical protein [Streptomyces graminilatus]